MPQMPGTAGNEEWARGGGQSLGLGAPRSKRLSRVQSTAAEGQGGTARRPVARGLTRREKQTPETAFFAVVKQEEALASRFESSRAVRARTSAVNVLPFQNKDRTLRHKKSFPPARNLGGETPRPEMGWASAETRKERARSQGTPHSFLSCWAGCGAAARPPPAAWRPVLGRRAGLGAAPPGCAVTGSGSPQGHIPPLHETTHRCSEGAGVSHVVSHRGTGKAGTQGQAHRPGRAGCREPAAVAPPGGDPSPCPA